MPLKELLNQNGIKQKWLAKNVGVSETTVSSWCNGKSKPRQYHIKRISSLLKVTQTTVQANL
ncbi:MAG: helix-turn-helix transcriptional regulator [Bacteroidota bacterium]